MKLFMKLALLLLLPVVGLATVTSEKEYALNRMNGTAQKYALGTELAKTTNGKGLLAGSTVASPILATISLIKL